MGNRVIQNSFTGGVISPSLIGRTDDVGYKAGAYKIENFQILPQGSMRSRNGLEFVYALSMTGNVRLIPFRYASDQTLVLVFSDYKMNILTEGQVLLADSEDTPYTLNTPFEAESLFQMDYSQNADILTFTSPLHPPYEIRRYGATDWRLLAVDVSPKLAPPTAVYTKAIYAPYLTDAESKDKNKLEVYYVVTALNEDGYESLPTAKVKATGNYYIDGCSIQVSWEPVDGASRYNVYREVAGVFGYIGYTESLSLNDVGNNPDMNTTPPKYTNPFGVEDGSITSITVTDGGSGYTYFKYPDNTFNVNEKWYFDQKMKFVWDLKSNAVNASDSSSQQKELDRLETGTSPNPIKFYIYIYTEEDATEPTFKYLLKTSTTTSVTKESTGSNEYKYVWHREVTFDSPFSFLEFKRKFSYLSFRIYWERSGQWCHKQGPLNFVCTWRDYPFDYTLSIPSTDANYAKLFSSTGVGISWYEFLALYKEAQTDTVSVIPLTITDAEGGLGSGATAFATARDGVIESVTITSSGLNYSSPKVTIAPASDEYSGVGALFNATASPISQNSNYPSAVTQFDQRRIFAGSIENPLRIWLTNAGVQDQMFYHVPVLADDRIQVTAVTADADRIKHAVALESLILLTGSSELRVYTQNSDSLSPSSIAVRAQSYIGANDAQPVIINSQVIYASSRGGHIYAMGYLSTAGGYITSDISIRAPHLFDGFNIRDLALCKAPVQTLYATSSNGRLLACTYYSEQNVVAWQEITSQDATFESCCCVAEGVEDRLYVVVNRNGNRSIERLGVTKIPLDKNEYTYLDSYSEGNFEEPVLTVTGLERFEGQTVAVFADGEQQSDKVVTDGQITLDTEAKHIIVGYRILCSFISLPVINQVEAYTQGRVKNISEIYVRCMGEGNLKGNNYGFQNLYDCMTATFGDSEIRQISFDGGWDYNGQLELKHDDALPIEINALIANVSLSTERTVG